MKTAHIQKYQLAIRQLNKSLSIYSVSHTLDQKQINTLEEYLCENYVMHRIFNIILEIVDN